MTFRRGKIVVLCSHLFQNNFSTCAEDKYRCHHVDKGLLSGSKKSTNKMITSNSHVFHICIEDKIAGPTTTDSRVCVTLQFTGISRAHNNNRLYQQKQNVLAKATSSQGNEDVTTMTFFFLWDHVIQDILRFIEQANKFNPAVKLKATFRERNNFPRHCGLQRR